MMRVEVSGKTNGWFVDIDGKAGDFSLKAQFEAPSGVTALFGPSGAGKSLLLRAVAGFWQPAHCRIAVCADWLCDTQESFSLPTPQRRLGAVFQKPLLFPHLTVAANLSYGKETDGLSSDRGRAVIAMLDLGALLERRPRHLSGGEGQRVALARALLSNPRALMLDEPLSALDDERRMTIIPYLERLREEADIPILYVSHRRDEILRLADHVVMVRGGMTAPIMTVAEFATLKAGGSDDD